MAALPAVRDRTGQFRDSRSLRPACRRSRFCSYIASITFIIFITYKYFSFQISFLIVSNADNAALRFLNKQNKISWARSCFYGIGSILDMQNHYPASKMRCVRSTIVSFADMEKLPDSFTFMYVNSLIWVLEAA